MGKYISDKNATPVGTAVELSGFAGAVSGDYLAANSALAARADWPLIDSDPDYTLEGFQATTMSGGVVGGSPASGTANKLICVSQNNSFVAVGTQYLADGTYLGGIWKSPDGVKWKLIKLFPNTSQYNTIRTENGIVFFVSPVDGIWKSTDNGDTWTQVIGGTWYGIAYGSSKYVISNGTNIGLYSADLITWTPMTFYTGHSVYDVVHNGTGFLGSTGAAATSYSTDGITWSLSTLPGVPDYYTTFVANGNFIVTDDNANAFWYGTNGSSWSDGTPSFDTSRGTNVIWDGTRYLFGCKNDASYYQAYTYTTSLAATCTVISMQVANVGASRTYLAYNGTVALAINAVTSDSQYGSYAVVKAAFQLSTINTNDANRRPIPASGQLKTTSSGRKYLFNRNSVASYRPTSIFVEDSSGYLTPLLSTNTTPTYGGNGYFWSDASASNYNFRGVASYENSLWTLLYGLYNGTNYVYNAALHNGTAILSTSPVATLELSPAMNDFETRYGLCVTNNPAGSWAYFIPNGSSAVVINTAIIPANAGTLIAASYDGTVIHSGTVSNFRVGLSLDGGRTWMKDQTPKHFSDAGAAVTLATNYIYKVNGRFISRMGSTLYAGASIFDLREVTGYPALIVNDYSLYEYAPGKLIGARGALTASGSKYQTSYNGASSQTYGISSAPVVIGNVATLSAHNSDTTSTNILVMNLPYDVATTFRAPYIPATATGKSYYVKGR
jgi:hypothetical protein